MVRTTLKIAIIGMRQKEYERLTWLMREENWGWHCAHLEFTDDGGIEIGWISQELPLAEVTKAICLVMNESNRFGKKLTSHLTMEPVS